MTPKALAQVKVDLTKLRQQLFLSKVDPAWDSDGVKKCQRELYKYHVTDLISIIVAAASKGRAVKANFKKHARMTSQKRVQNADLRRHQKTVRPCI